MSFLTSFSNGILIKDATRPPARRYGSYLAKQARRLKEHILDVRQAPVTNGFENKNVILNEVKNLRYCFK